MPDRRVAANHLQKFLNDLFLKLDMPAEDAEFTAKCIVKSELWGVTTHGAVRVGVYEERLRRRIINPRPKMADRLGGDTPIGILDGDDGIGFVVGRDGMRLAIDKAKKHGISLVIAVNSNHYGAAGLYSRLASRAGLLGLTTTNVRPNTGSIGSIGPTVGNNPVALSAPIPGAPDFTIDIAMSVIPVGKLKLAALKGEQIAPGLALDAEGRETTDPVAASKGMILSVGNHKGFGLALFFDIITGVLGGGSFLGDISSMYSHPDAPSKLVHAFAAIDPERFMTRAEFDERMAEWRRKLKATPMVEGMKELIIPGEPEIYKEEELRVTGIPLSNPLWAELEEVAKRHGLAMPETM